MGHKPADLLTRLTKSIDKSDPSGCWLWTGNLCWQGYGRCYSAGGTRLAHRVMYELLVGPIPSGLELDHLCRVRNCVNPAHLEPVTSAENLRRSRVNRTHCPRGHEYTPDNKQRVTNKKGVFFRCATCHRAREHDRYHKRRAALVAAAVVVALFSIGFNLAPPDVDARPLPAHHVVVGFGAAHCLPTGVWQSVLSVTADVAGGTAHLQPQGVTGFDLPMPVNNLFSIGPKVATYTVVVTVSWPDGFVAPALTATATRPPEGCTVPTTSTTDCAHAIPIRDCTEVTTSPSSVPTTSTIPPPSPTAPSTATSVTSGGSADATVVRRTTPTTTPNRLNLPATGTDWPAVVAAGIATAIVGAGLVLCARRRGV